MKPSNTRYAADKEEYEKYITDLTTEITKNKKEIERLEEELKKTKNLVCFFSKESCCQSAIEKALEPYKQKIEELNTRLQIYEKSIEELKDKLMNMEELNQEHKNALHVKQINEL